MFFPRKILLLFLPLIGVSLSYAANRALDEQSQDKIHVIVDEYEPLKCNELIENIHYSQEPATEFYAGIHDPVPQRQSLLRKALSWLRKPEVYVPFLCALVVCAACSVCEKYRGKSLKRLILRT